MYVKMDCSVNISSNWCRVGGCTFPNSVQERASNPDLFIKPHLNELVDDERSILLSKDKSLEFCELYLKLLVHYKIQAVSFVCNVVKVEIFQGPIKEYLKTIYGDVVDEPDDEFRSYRYDFEFEKSSVTDLTLRFLTDSSDVCIFGIMLHIDNNSVGTTTHVPNSGCLNVQNIGNMLQSSTERSKAIPDKVTKLLELITKTNQHNSLLLDHHVKPETNVVGEERSTTVKDSEEDVFHGLKSYIDNRFQEIELRLNTYLRDMEQRQNQKLDMIINILEKNIK